MRVLNFAFTLTPNLKCLFKTHSLSNKHSWWKIRQLGKNSKWIPYKFHRGQLWPWHFDLEMWFSVTAHPLPTSASCGKVYYMGENKWLGQVFWIYIYIYMSLTLTFCFRNLVQGHCNPYQNTLCRCKPDCNKKRENMLLDQQVK